MELVEFIFKHPHPNPPPSRGREYLYQSTSIYPSLEGRGIRGG
jgi:hypothetical protein